MQFLLQPPEDLLFLTLLVELLVKGLDIVLFVLVQLDLDVDEGLVGLVDELDDLIDVVRLECRRLEGVDHQLLVDAYLAGGLNDIVVAQHAGQRVV